MGVKSVVRPQQGVQKMARDPPLGWEGGGGGIGPEMSQFWPKLGVYASLGCLNTIPNSLDKVHGISLAWSSPKHIPGGTLLITFTNATFDPQDGWFRLLEWWNILSIFIVENQREK